MLSKFLFVIFLFAMTISVSAQPPNIETGVSQTLARWRAANYSDVRYELNLTLERRAPLLKGEIEIRVNLTETGAKSDLILDWRTTQFANDKDKPYARVVAVNEKNVAPVSGVDSVNYYVSDEHLGVSRFLLKPGENVVKIEFASPVKTSGAAVTRYVDKEDGAEYVYSLFVPSDASTAFPVFDQPDLKARFSLSVTAPLDWKVVSNSFANCRVANETIPTEKLDLYRRSQTEAFNKNPSANPAHECLLNIPAINNTFTSFNETKPISTYVFAFAAGEFAEVYERDEQMLFNKIPLPGASNESPETPLKIYVRKSQAEKFKAHKKETFRLNREAVKFLESYFDFKFPFPKYDLVLIPEFPFNGMEHAGATFLRESSVIFPSEPTKNDLVSRANVIFHEAAHQWFGDTVTMKWFDDLWLKEGFAEFMAYKTLEKVLPEYNAWKAFYERNKPLAYLTDSTKGTTPIYQPIPNLSSAKSAYGNIVYRKAPSFLRQAEFYLGEEKFQTAVRAFLKKHQFKNAEWTDLVKEFETASGQDLKDWATVWVKQPGLLKIRMVVVRANKDTRKVDTTDYLAGPETEQSLNLNKNQPMKFKILTLDRNETRSVNDFKLTGAYNSLVLGGKGDPVLMFPNYGDYGYGIFLLDEQSRAYVLKNIQYEKDDFLRSMMWGTLWDSVREAELNPKDYVELAIKNIAVETDELTIQTILNRVSTAMNYYLSDAQRAEVALPLESLLLGGMLRAKTTGQKITFFRAYLNLASSAEAQAMLKKILKSGGKPIEIETIGSVTGKMPQLELPPLKTKDKFDIVTRLLILENKRLSGNNEAERLLAELEKTETSDDAKRYAYAAGAGVGTKAAKEKYFNDFLNNKEISESWIEAAFVPFNSVRHSELTLPYLEKALAELPNLKRSRKIFFVNGWLAAFIGGQKDEKALAAVNKFLADNPNLDKDLRLKILENVDALERAVRIRAKYGK